MSDIACSTSSESDAQLFNPFIAQQFMEYNIEIFGTKDEPLFKAKDIGEMLGIGNIRETIKNYGINHRKDDVSYIDTIGRMQKGTFLTETGLYKVIFKSRKPFAEDFQILFVTC